MKYAYYPGCSLRESAQEFDVSVRAVMERLGCELEEIPDWTCCGASAVESVDAPLMRALPARNLALAERDLPGLDVLAPCSACYLNLLKFQRAAKEDRAVMAEANELLAGEGLAYAGSGGRTRHLLDILINDLGPRSIEETVRFPLTGVSVAPYYGCQILRPYQVFDDPERPTSMEAILVALGASIHPWSVGGRCCGASLMATHKETALVSVGEILRAANEPAVPRSGAAGDAKSPGKGDGPGEARGADLIVTVCPMCQMNLDAYQSEALRAAGAGKPVTVLYLSQLIALAMGLPDDRTMLDKNLAVTAGFRSRISDARAHGAPAQGGA